MQDIITATDLGAVERERERERERQSNTLLNKIKINCILHRKKQNFLCLFCVYA